MKVIVLLFFIFATAKAGEPDGINIKLEDLIPVKATVNTMSISNSLTRENELARDTNVLRPGIQAIHGFFPYQVAVLVDGRSICSGALINSRTVLTAAHCVYKHNINVVTVGMQRLLCVNCREESRTTVAVKIHENYNQTTMANDLAILEVNVPFNTSSTWIRTVAPIPKANGLLTNNWVRASGWGSSSVSGIDGFLRYIDLNVITNDECKRYFGEFVTNSNVCAISRNNRETCVVDSGSPLVDMRSGQLIGVATFRSFEGCQKGLPVAYVRLSSFDDWIRRNS